MYKRQAQNREAAKEASGNYTQTKDSLNNSGKEQNLSEKEGYPSKYPSGIAKTSASATGDSPAEVDVSADKKAVESSKDNVDLLKDVYKRQVINKLQKNSWQG